jgi:hypothetical protein
MKTIALVVLAGLFSTLSFAQKTEWKQMSDFHKIISKTFHSAEEGNLKPTKDSAQVLVAKAKVWQKFNVPAGYNAKVTEPILKRLVADCEALEKAVKAGKPDAELKKLISKVHDTFHEIMEKCMDEKKG